MSLASDIFDHHANFDPAEDFEAFFARIPARWVVYLLADADDQSVQLLCVKNLRASLKRRLGGNEMIGPTRKVNYRDLIRRVYWIRVDSTFEADITYFEAARRLFPDTYRGMVGFRPAWFIHVDPDAEFPRYVKTTDLSRPSGSLIGPLEDKHAAGRLIELIEDAFDLCRYYNILVQSPAAKACAYKEMGKCPAPCDGSISLEQYRRLVELSLAALIEPADYLRQQRRRMDEAAAELRFETAAKIKKYVDDLSQLGQGPFRHARRLADFAFLTLQRGPRARSAKLFLVTPGQIELIGCLIDPPQPPEILRVVFERAEEKSLASLDSVAAERLGVVVHHLLAAGQRKGAFIPLDQLDEQSLMRAYRDLQKRGPTEPPPGDSEEGVLRELAAM